MHSMHDDINNAEARLNSTAREIATSGITASNKATLTRLRHEAVSMGRSYSTALNQQRICFVFAQWLGRDFQGATIEDLRAVVSRIEASALKPATKSLYKIILKQLYRWLERNGLLSSDIFSWIKVGCRKDKPRSHDILAQDEVARILSSCADVRDRALVAVLYESGGRIGEVLGLRLGRIVPTHFGYDCHLFGKTGARTVPLVDAAPYLTAWLNHHPLGNEPENPVWVCTGPRNTYRRLGKSGAREIILKWGKRAGITKRLNPHSFRHARATHLANADLSEAKMCKYFGWQCGSKMPSIYIHLSGVFVRDSILKLHGISSESKNSVSPLAPRVCPKCGFQNAATSRLCERCVIPLDSALTRQIQTKADQAASSPDHDMLALLIQNGLRQILAEKGLGLERIQEILSSRHEPSPSPS